MRCHIRIGALAVGLLVMGLILSPTVRAQGLGGANMPRPGIVNVPRIGNIGIQTTVTVPDGGTVLLGGYTRVSEGRNQFGTPGLGKVPYVGRGFGNVGYGREAVVGRVTATVRIINLYEEEERQTGVRSRP